MSVKVMGQVWDLALPHNKLLVLLALADHADHEGHHVHPSLELIAWKTGYEERQVRRIVRSLETDGLLTREKAGGGRRKPTEYSINLAKAVKKSPFRTNPDILTGNEDKPGHFDRELEENPDILTGNDTRNPDIAMSPEPSLRFKTKEKEKTKEGGYVLSDERTRAPVTPEILIAWYNAETPENQPKVTRLSPARRTKAAQYLRMFPDPDFWHTVFQGIAASSFLQGLKPSNGHESFRADFDWLLSKGKDGTENCVKVAEGKYRDQAACGQERQAALAALARDIEAEEAARGHS